MRKLPDVSGTLDLFASTRTRWLLLLASTALVLARLDRPDLWPPDEPRYALVAEELRSMEHGLTGVVLLHLNGEPYTQKPPLFYWFAAAAGAWGGRVTEFAARLPSALAGLTGIAATMALGGLLFGRAVGTLAGVLLLTTIDWIDRARSVQLDTLLALFETTALLAFWRFEVGLGSRRRNVAFMHGSLALAVLAKGPVGWIIPMLAVVTYLAWERRLSALRELLPAWGLALSIGPAVAWMATAVALAPPGYFQMAVIDNLFGRALAGAAHAQPFHYYLRKFPFDLVPWILLLPVSVWAGCSALGARAGADERRAWRFLAGWIATSFVFFSAATGKRLRYLVPIEPAFALLFAATLEIWLARAARPLHALAIAAGTVGIAALGASAFTVVFDPFHQPPIARAVALGLVAIVAGGTAGWGILAYRGSGPAAHVALLAACIWAGQLLSSTVALPALDATRSPRPAAEAAASLARPDERIGLFRADIANAVAYYGRRRVVPVNQLPKLAEFVASGGRVLVFEEALLEQVLSVTPISVRTRLAIDGKPWLITEVGRSP